MLKHKSSFFLTSSHMKEKTSRKNPIYKTSNTALICFTSCTLFADDKYAKKGNKTSFC